jgi:hypothetical protein
VNKELKRSTSSITSLIVILIFLFISLTCWALSSPVGSSPDDDYHLSSIWCAESVLNPDCKELSKGIEIPGQLLANKCFAFQLNMNGSCTENLKNESVAYGQINNLRKLYPGGFYSVLSILKSENKTLFVFKVRLFNTVLFIIGLLIIYFMAKDFDFWLKSLFIQIVSLIPLGFFLIPSTNPSSWSLIFLPGLWIAMYIVGKREESRLLKGDVLAILFFWLCINFSRSDGALYTLISLFSILIIFFGKKIAARRNFFLLNFILIIFSTVIYLMSKTARSVSNLQTGISGEVSKNFDSDLLWYNLQNITFFFTGSAGKTGLGWLDTFVPSFVWQSMTVVITSLLIISVLLLLNQRNYRGLTSSIFLTFVYLAIPMIVLQVNGYIVSEFIQPRYMLPLLVIVILASLLEIRVSQNAVFLILVFLSPILWINFALSLGTNIQRYSGIKQDPLNFLLYLESYWSMFNIAPLNILLLGVTSFGLLLLYANYSYWNFYIRKEQPLSL